MDFHTFHRFGSEILAYSLPCAFLGAAQRCKSNFKLTSRQEFWEVSVSSIDLAQVIDVLDWVRFLNNFACAAYTTLKPCFSPCVNQLTRAHQRLMPRSVHILSPEQFVPQWVGQRSWRRSAAECFVDQQLSIKSHPYKMGFPKILPLFGVQKKKSLEIDPIYKYT